MPSIISERIPPASRRRAAGTPTPAPAAAAPAPASAASIQLPAADLVRTRLVPDCGWPTEANVDTLRPSRAARNRAR